MKKGFAILLACSLLLQSGCGGAEREAPGAAGGEASVSSAREEAPLLAEALGVPEHYTYEEASDSGICQVTADADILVPEVSAVDVLEAVPAAFTDSQLASFAAHCADGAAWRDAVLLNPYEGEGCRRSTSRTEDGEEVFCSLYLEEIPGEETWYDRRQLTSSYSFYSGTGELYRTPVLEYAVFTPTNPELRFFAPFSGEPGSSECEMTYEEAKAVALAEAARFSPDFAIARAGLSQYSDTASASSGNYHFRLTRSIGGVPVNPPDDMGVSRTPLGYVPETECIDVTVGDEGVVWFRFSSPIAPGGVLEEDVELLSFETIAGVFEAVALLTLEELEVYDDLERYEMKVCEIRFGYMVVPQAGEELSYRYVPVWDFYGSASPQYENAYVPPDVDSFPDPVGASVVFTVDARNGAVIDRGVGY